MDFKQFYKTINFDIDNEIRTVYQATQGDTKSRGLLVDLIVGGDKTPVTTETMNFFALKPDGTRVMTAGVKDGDKFRIDFTNQTFAVPGVLLCTLVLNGANGEKIADRKFKMTVDSSLEDGAIISKDERGILDRAFEMAIDILPRFEAIDLVKLETAEIKETERLASETIRLASEQGRVDAEATRVQKETERKQSEEARENNEETRITAENERKSAETERKNAETSRVSAENGRTTAETARVEAETTRAGFYDGFDARLTDLETKTLKRYGVRRTLGATSPLLTRIYDSVGKTAQVPTDDGNAANDFDSLFPWSRIRECKIKNGRIYYKNDPGYNALADCDWMVEIPKFYLRIEQTTTERDIAISQYKHAGYWTPQVFKTESGAELDRIYVGRFKTGNIGGVDVSRPEIFPDNFRDLASFRTGAKSKGKGWQLIDLSYVQEILHPLYMVESANLNSQDYLGNGITSARYTADDLSKLTETATNRIVIGNSSATYYNVGEDINIGTARGSHNVARNRTIVSKNQLNTEESEIVFDGDSVDILAGHFLWQGAQRNGQTKNLTKPSGKLSGISGRTSIKYRGMEDVFGNVYEWVDGVLINDLTAHVCRKPSLYSSSLSEGYAPTSYINSDTNGYPLEMGWDENYPEARFPVSVGAGSTTGYSDYYYQNLGLRGAYFGGSAGNGSLAGLFFWTLSNAPSTAGWSVGSRLLFKPPV